MVHLLRSIQVQIRSSHVFDGTSYVNFDTTDANGFYLFDNLAPGQYWVHIPAAEFGSGNVLFNHISTQPNNESNPAIAPAPITDSNDNGTPDDGSATTLGVTSGLETLGILDSGSGLYIPNNSEPVLEINKSNNPPTPSNTYDGPVSIGRYGELDNNSDITIDFGFILADSASMSIGNRVWFDNDRNGLIGISVTIIHKPRGIRALMGSRFCSIAQMSVGIQSAGRLPAISQTMEDTIYLMSWIPTRQPL